MKSARAKRLKPLTVRDLHGRVMNTPAGKVTLAVKDHAYIVGGVVVEATREGEDTAVVISVSAHEVTLAPDEVSIKRVDTTKELVAAAWATKWFADTGRRIELGFCVGEVWRVVK